MIPADDRSPEMHETGYDTDAARDIPARRRYLPAVVQSDNLPALRRSNYLPAVRRNYLPQKRRKSDVVLTGA